MFELFENLTNWLWGLPLLITILATGVYLTVRSGFFQFRHFGYIVKNMFSKERRQEGGDDGKSLTPFQAISIAIGGTVGVSNMSGVATAIATGGPGALFWLWIAALLAMVIKMAEVTLAVYYREKQPNGEYQGGPTYYMQKGLGGEKKLPCWKLFAVLCGGCIFPCVSESGSVYGVADMWLLFMAFFAQTVVLHAAAWLVLCREKDVPPKEDL